MADFAGEKAPEVVDNHNYGVGIEQQMPKFGIKGAENYDWGMKARLAKIFNPKDGNAVVFAIDHGQTQGPTHGLERIDLLVPEVEESVDVIMACRGAFKTAISPRYGKGIILRTDAGNSILSYGGAGSEIAVEVEEAIRMDALARAVGCQIGAEPAIEHRTIMNLHRAVNEGNRYGIPTLGVVTVGREMKRDNRYYLLATRSISETGCQIIKTYYTETEFEKITTACPVPIIIAGGKVLPEKEALELTYKAMAEGARGVDMGRNIFQAACPKAMARSINLIVHGGESAAKAYEAYEQFKSELGK